MEIIIQLFFFKTINSRRNRDKILSITRVDGTTSNEPEGIQHIVIHHFQSILGNSSSYAQYRYRELHNFSWRQLSDEQVLHLSIPITEDEIKRASFSIHSNKAP
ncbi:unnamed protein product, partial [Ilex paraguariensis]